VAGAGVASVGGVDAGGAAVESVDWARAEANQVIDASAIDAARSLRYVLE
jgi:hypothetical protein